MIEFPLYIYIEYTDIINRVEVCRKSSQETGQMSVA